MARWAAIASSRCANCAKAAIACAVLAASARQRVGNGELVLQPLDLGLQRFDKASDSLYVSHSPSIPAPRTSPERDTDAGWLTAR